MKLTGKLKSSSPVLCISLIDNDAQLARATEAAGADGIKLHMNLSHGPTGRVLAGIDREIDRIRAVVQAVKVPVGIVPRGRAGTTVGEVERLRDAGVEFVDLYGKFMNPAVAGVPGIDTWVAPTPDYTTEMLRVLAARSDVDVIEASFFPVDPFGSPLAIDDLVRLELGLKALEPSGKPLVVPTDRRLETSDLPALLEIGVKNYLLGFAVTGDSLATVVAATERFRKELDSLAG